MPTTTEPKRLTGPQALIVGLLMGGVGSTLAILTGANSWWQLVIAVVVGALAGLVILFVTRDRLHRS